MPLAEGDPVASSGMSLHSLLEGELILQWQQKQAASYSILRCKGGGYFSAIFAVMHTLLQRSELYIAIHFIHILRLMSPTAFEA